MGLFWLDRPQIGFKFGFIPMMKPNQPNLNPILGQVGPLGSKFGLSQVGSPRSKFRLSPLVGFIQLDLNLQSFKCGNLKS